MAALANLLFVLGTMVVMIEGLICAVVIAPLFMVMGGLGGLLMRVICRKMIWPRTSLYSIVALPMLLGALGGGGGQAEHSIGRVERSRVIDAPAAAAWREIHEARDIRPEEVERAWMYRIDVPVPQSGVTQDTAQGRVRRITMGKSIHFEQVVQAWEENCHVRWTYRFEKDSIPPGALDDHVAIGG